jgi:hypothetical protein
MITIPSKAFGAIDRDQPFDDRTDFEIEMDAANRAQAKRNSDQLANLLAMPRDDAMWDAVEANRKAEQNKHVHPAMRGVLKMFG